MKIKTKKYRAVGGVFDGQLLRLSSDSPCTMVFSIKGRKGSYQQSANNPHRVVWQPA